VVVPTASLLWISNGSVNFLGNRLMPEQGPGRMTAETDGGIPLAIRKSFPARLIVHIQWLTHGESAAWISWPEGSRMQRSAAPRRRAGSD
jgi:hypothetical protein